MYVMSDVVANVLAISGIVAIISLFLILLFLGYIFSSIGMYIMAKKKGSEHPWFAWLPFVRDYLKGELVDDKVIFGGLVIPYASWILLGIAIAEGMLVAIPFIGFLIAVVILLYCYATDYRLYKLYKPESAVAYLVLTIIFCWTPLLQDIFIFTLRKHDPVEYLKSEEPITETEPEKPGTEESVENAIPEIEPEADPQNQKTESEEA